MLDTRKAILVVDDEVATRKLLAEIFVAQGHRVRVAADGFAALRLMREERPDLLISDLNMPGMSGFELLSVVRRLYPDLYVLATSGAYSGTEVPNGIAADAFYEKATNLKYLFHLIERGLEASVPQGRIVSPIWLTPAEQLAADAIYVLIGCPDCLRTFPRMLSDRASQILETGCPYCDASISYAILNPEELVQLSKLESVVRETERWNAIEPTANCDKIPTHLP